MFKDVPKKHWAAKTIAWLAKYGIIVGDDAGNVRPDEFATRAEVMSLIERVLLAVNGKVTGRIVLDPGHGGRDPGSIGYSGDYIEANGVLDVALRLKPMLEAVGIEVMLTRETDEYLSLEDRAALANDWGSDALISIHSNSADASVRGTETFCSVHESDFALAKALQAAMVGVVGQRDRGVKQRWNSKHTADYYRLLRLSEVPAVILEPEFHSHPHGEAFLLCGENRQALAVAIGGAIIDWLREVKK